MLNSVEVLVTIGLIYMMLKYWNRKLRTGYSIETGNKAFGIFISFQIVTILLVVVHGINPQNALYMEGFSMFGKGAYDYWSIVGVQIVGFSLALILANLMGHLLFMVGYQSEKGLYEEIKEDNLAASLIASVLILTIGFVLSHFVLNPFIFEWISRNAAFIPLS